MGGIFTGIAAPRHGLSIPAHGRRALPPAAARKLEALRLRALKARAVWEAARETAEFAREEALRQVGYLGSNAGGQRHEVDRKAAKVTFYRYRGGGPVEEPVPEALKPIVAQVERLLASANRKRELLDQLAPEMSETGSLVRNVEEWLRSNGYSLDDHQ